MPIEVLMPALSPTMLEGKILGWKKNEGDLVDTSSVIAEIETDKAVMELEAPEKGTLAKILHKNLGEQVKVGTLIAVVAKKNDTEQDIQDFIASFANSAKVEVSLVEKSQEVQVEQGCSLKVVADTQIAQYGISSATDLRLNNTPSVHQACNKIKASPLAKKIALEHNINLSSIQSGSGPMGRIIKDDVETYLNSKQSASGGIFYSNPNRNNQEFTQTAVSHMRKAIAGRLTQSKQQIPHFYISFEVQMDRFNQVREELNSILSSEDAGRYKISVNDMIVKAVSLALERNQKINSSWQEDKIIQYNNVDVCVAVALENGLITPIVKNCNKKGLVAISQEIKDLARRAKEGKLKSEEFQGGGFTISNLGNYSAISSFTAIVNPPQAAILSVAAIQEKPIVKNGKIEIAKVCEMQISADHRALDGADVAKFATDIKDIIENKTLSLLL